MSAARTRSNNRLPLLIVAGLVIVGAIVLLVVSGQRGASETAPEAAAQQTESPLLALAHREPGDPLAMGDVDAPVVLIEWGDLRCPFCGVYSRDVQPALVEQYVETGQLRIEWRDLPVFGEQSTQAAIAARAAGDQGLYWEFNEAVYAVAPEGGHADIDRARLMQFATEIGIPDLDRFEASLDDPAIEQAVLADLAEGQSLGITGTPTFVIGSTPVVGAQPLEAFQRTIEAEIAAAQ